PRPADTVLHLYVDADANPDTGRKGPKGGSFTGTEYMLTVAAGRGRTTHFTPDGHQSNGPPVTYVVHGNTLLLSADIALGRDAQGLRFGLYVLCHSTTESGQSPRMSDSTRKKLVTGIPLSPRKKTMRPSDYVANHNVDATFGLDVLRAVLAAKDTVVVRHDQLALDGFAIDDLTSRRWPHLKRLRHNARAWAAAPKAGVYHVGFMMYDDSRGDRVSIHVADTLRGVAVANQDNNRTWLYWLRDPIQLNGGERVELRGVGTGTHGLINLLFLPKPPAVRNIRYAVENMTAVPHVDAPRTVTLSWTTTWPCPTRLEYGRDTKYGATLETEGHCLVHRVVLRDLEPGVEYHGRAIGTARDGKPFLGSDFAFRAAPPTPQPTKLGTSAVPLTVRNPHPFPAKAWPATTGVPFPQGVLASADHVRLTRGTSEVPAQVRLTARWRDGSVKWLLVTFLADAPAEGTSAYRLEYGRDVRRAPVTAAVTEKHDASGLAIDTGAARFRIGPGGDVAGITTMATAADGTLYATPATGAEIAVEEAGPLRVVVKVISHLTKAGDAQKDRLFRIEKRIEACRGATFLRIHHTFVVAREQKFTDIRSLACRVPVPPANTDWSVPLAAGGHAALNAKSSAVQQQFDGELVRTEGGKRLPPQKGRIVGSAIGKGAGGLAVTVRDAWQNYPFAFSLEPGGLHVGLCPPFESGLYDKFPFEKEGHHLYYPLRNGVYRLKHGTSKTHELLLCVEPDEKKRGQLATLFQRPLLATAPPEWHCNSRAFYDVAPRDTTRLKLYEEAIDRNLKAYAAARERQHDFGLLNYGDWYGERGANWGNIEYDTQHAFFLEYIRSGNPDAFFLGCQTELHNRDVDTVHWHTDPAQVGNVYVHQMGHVGEYYTKSVPGTLGIPRAGGSVSHAWTEGHFDHYFLTGDRRSYETGRAVADFFIRKQLGRPYDFLTTRTPGWHLIMLASAYAATGDPYYLNAARLVTERVLETQDGRRPLPAYQSADRRSKPYQEGGWSRMMRPGHCQCTPRHRGNAGFMVAVLLSGLKYYHDVVPDPRVKDSIIRGAHYLL
ncbi:hypothetical protein HQ576_06010, partial [bacterium]|nr:hypothetical protein [bacterium]